MTELLPQYRQRHDAHLAGEMQRRAATFAGNLAQLLHGIPFVGTCADDSAVLQRCLVRRHHVVTKVTKARAVVQLSQQHSVGVHEQLVQAHHMHDEH